MRASFPALRTEMPMNCTLLKKDFQPADATPSDIARKQHLWDEFRESFGKRGPWLFGACSIADAMYAPVVLRFNSYVIAVSGAAKQYTEAVLQQQALTDWQAASRAEPDTTVF